MNTLLIITEVIENVQKKENKTVDNPLTNY